MDDFRKRRALELVEHLERAGMNCGLLAVQGTVVLRRPGAPYTDTPIVMFNEADLQNAGTLQLLAKQKVECETFPGAHHYSWEWYVVKKPTGP
jgi:hypothetical protein